MAGWLRGQVKEVVSGDTLVIVGAVKAGPAPEKRLTLSSLIAPKPGKRDGTSRDEPFAWASREFLRTKLIGQQVVFKVDYIVDTINREFGSVFLDKENVAVSLVAAGLAKVRTGQQQSPYIENLKKAEEQAQLAGLGVWTKDSAAQAAAVRNVPLSDDSFNATAFLASVGKGKTVTGIVEAVANGTTLRLTLLPDYQQITLVLSGVQAPSMGRRAPAAAAAPAVPAGEGATTGNAVGAPPSAAAVAAATSSEPYAVEAKFLTEMRALNREVKVTLEGVDKYNNLFGSVTLPPAPTPAAATAAATAAGATAGAAAAGEESLAEVLLRAGYAKCVEWSLGLMASGSQRLRDIERVAKTEKRAIWTNYVAPPTTQAKLSDTFTGKVVEVVSGDCLVIKDTTSGAERRVQLSSLRAPRTATRDRTADPWATDAKEFLRKKLVGREVEVKMEYTRKVPALGGGGDDSGERTLSFGNVEVVPDKGEEKQNVGEMVVARGYASVIKHRSDEERSSVYERLVECEEMAKAAKRGLHSSKEPAANRINDVSAPGNAAKAKQYLPFFQRAGKMQGVVEYVLSGHRLKVNIPKEGVTIVFAPSGIKTPQRAQGAVPGKPAMGGEPFADEAVAFTREAALQRDCELTIETMDRGGTFLGAITIAPATPSGKPLDLALALVRAGLARIQPGMEPSRLANGVVLAEAQRAAKEARAKIWLNWTPEQELAEAGGDAEEEASAAGSNGAARASERLDVVVTDVVDANEFYVQRVGEPRLGWITEQLRAAGAADPPAIPPELRAGALCLAQYSLDKQWYRAYVEKANAAVGQYEVFFIDYGNREKVSDRAVRNIDAALGAVPPQALQCSLAYLKVPVGAADYAAEARGLLGQLLGGGAPMVATVVAKEKPGPKDNAKHPKWANGKLVVRLAEAETGADVAVELLAAGLARLPKLKRVKDAAGREAVNSLAPYEEEAREAHRGVYTYGDPGDSEDEEAAAPKPGAWGKPR